MAGWLLLHGFTGAPESFAELTRQLPDNTWLAPGLTGHGPEPYPTSNDFNSEVERLATLSRQHLPLPVRLLGYSLGARLALGLLARDPEQFASAVLVGVNPGLQTHQQRAARRAADARLAARLRERGLQEFLAYWQALPLFQSQRRLPAVHLLGQQRIRHSHTEQGLCLALSALGLGSMPSYWSALPKLDLPVDLVVGDQDAKFTRLALAMSQLLPRARLLQVPQVGHNVVLEAPQFIQQLMLEHLESDQA